MLYICLIETAVILLTYFLSVIVLWTSALLLTLGPLKLHCVVPLGSTQDGCCSTSLYWLYGPQEVGRNVQNLGETDFWPVENYLSCREDCQRKIGKSDMSAK